MLNEDRSPTRAASRRRIRAQAEWKVETHMRCATGPTRPATRSFISPAALFVNVMARRPNGETRFVAIRYATRWVSTRVLPEPAPATMSSGPSGAVAASRWTGFRPARSASTSGSAAGATGASVSGMTEPSYRRASTGPALRSRRDAQQPGAGRVEHQGERAGARVAPGPVVGDPHRGQAGVGGVGAARDPAEAAPAPVDDPRVDRGPELLGSVVGLHGAMVRSR